jgi:hypothetical protein
MFSDTIAFIQDNAAFLSWINSLDHAQSLGLSNGSLHDVLTGIYPGSGPAQVSAMGFNITCGHFPGVTVYNSSNLAEGIYNISLGQLAAWNILEIAGDINLGELCLSIMSDESM